MIESSPTKDNSMNELLLQLCQEQLSNSVPLTAEIINDIVAMRKSSSPEPLPIAEADVRNQYSPYIGQRQVYILVYYVDGGYADWRVNVERLWESEITRFQDKYPGYVVDEALSGGGFPRIYPPNHPYCILRNNPSNETSSFI